MNDSSQEANQPVSELRIAELKKRGQSPKSAELVASFQLLLVSLALYLVIDFGTAQFSEFALSSWSDVQTDWANSEELIAQFVSAASQFGAMMGLLFMAIISLSIVPHLIQNPRISLGNSKFIHFENLAFSTGVTRLFSFSNCSKPVLGVPKFIVLVSVAIYFVHLRQGQIFSSMHCSAEFLPRRISAQIFQFIFAITGSMTLLSLFDYGLEQIHFFRRNRMTEQEIRDENRMQEIDPQIVRQRNQLLNTRVKRI